MPTGTSSMSSNPISIAVAGVSGRLGSLITTYLLDFPHVTVHGLYRPESASKVLSAIANHPRFLHFPGANDTPIAARTALSGCAAVICTYNNIFDLEFMFTAQKLLIDACEAEGVGRYFASDYTMDLTRLEIGELPLKDPMIRVYRYLKDGHANDQLKIVKGVHILAGAFVGAFFHLLWRNDGVEYWGNGTERWDMITYDTVAQYTAHAAVDETCPAGILRFRQFHPTIQEIASIVNAQKSLAGIAATPVSNAGSMTELKEKVDQARASGAWLRNIALFCAYYFQTPAYQLGDSSKLDNERYPDVKGVSLQEAVKACLI